MPPKREVEKTVLKVSLNGTSVNPFHKFGLTRNPFPQLANAKYDSHCMVLASLGADPIPHDSYEAHIRKTLDGFRKEFVDLCVEQFRPGEMVRFSVGFDE